MWVPKIFLFFCSLEAQQLRAVQSWVASCFKIGRVSESSLRPLLWQAKLDHLIHAVFLHWAIAMQASRQKDLRGDISWVHSVLQ